MIVTFANNMTQGFQPISRPIRKSKGAGSSQPLGVPHCCPPPADLPDVMASFEGWEVRPQTPSEGEQSSKNSSKKGSPKSASKKLGGLFGSRARTSASRETSDLDEDTMYHVDTAGPERSSARSGFFRRSYNERSTSPETSIRESTRGHKFGLGGGITFGFKRSDTKKKGQTQGRIAEKKHHHGASKLSRSLGDTVTAVVLSEDRELIAACSTNKKAIVVDSSDGRIVGEFTGDAPLNAMAIGLKGQNARLIVGTFNGWIRIYHIASNREELNLQFEGSTVNCIALAANATRLAVGGKAAHILMYALSLTDEAVGMNVLFQFKTHGPNTLSLSLDAAGELLVAGGESKVVQMWAVSEAEVSAIVAGSAASLQQQNQTGAPAPPRRECRQMEKGER